MNESKWKIKKIILNTVRTQVNAMLRNKEINCQYELYLSNNTYEIR